MHNQQEPLRITHITTHTAVNGITFGSACEALITRLGAPDQALQNYTGELEMLFGDTFYRFFDNRFVEATCPAIHHVVIDGTIRANLFDWLGAQADVVDKARFRISLTQGMAYDYRNPAAGSLTVFEPGRWDALVLG